MTKRTDQVGAFIQKELGEHMLGLELPAMTTISRVEVTADLKHAKIWVTIFTEDLGVEKQVLKILNANIYEIQGRLNRTLVMHHAPRIAFTVDNSLHYASRINELIKRTQDDNEDKK